MKEKTKINVEIPELLLNELEKVPLKTKKTKEYALRLIASVLHFFDEEEISPNVYAKPFSVQYIKSLTSPNFYSQVFCPYLKDNLLDRKPTRRIFETNGFYIPKLIELHYRINPSLLKGRTVTKTITLELESLNSLFPIQINHLINSGSLVKPKWSEGNISGDIKRRSNEFGIVGVDEHTGYFSKSIEATLGLSSEMIELPNFISTTGRNKRKVSKKYLSDEVKQKIMGSKKDGLMLIHEHDSKNKSKANIVDWEEYIKQKRVAYLRRVHGGVSRVLRNEWNPNISPTNGRLNHTLTNLDKFCIQYFTLAGEDIHGFDLQSAQPTIHSNLMFINPELEKSLRNSKNKKLRMFLDKNPGLFFKQEDKSWLKAFTHSDIYTLMGDSIGITREEAKTEMMQKLFTEPGKPSRFDPALKQHFPIYYEQLEKTKKAFLLNMGSSKKTFPVFLQMVEAHIFIEIIYTAIAAANIPAIPKHDCILFPKSRLKEVAQIISDCFSRLNFVGKINPEKEKSAVNPGVIQWLKQNNYPTEFIQGF